MTIGWMIPYRGSIFSASQEVVLTAVVLIVCTLLSIFSCNPENKSSKACVPFPIPSTSYLTLLTLCSFLLGFSLNIMLGRWWNVRMHLGDVTAGSGALVSLLTSALSSSLSSSSKKQETLALAKLLTEDVISYLAIALALLINSGRYAKSLKGTEVQSEITTKQLEYFDKNPSPADAYAIISRILQDACEMNLLGDPRHIGKTNLLILTERVYSIQGSSCAISVYLGTKLSYPFVQVLFFTCIPLPYRVLFPHHIHVITFHNITFHIITFHIITFHVISYHNISYHVIS
jgi:hypothetical protein